MKLDIYSEDRLGITEQILAVFASQGWNLLAMEMEQYHTYVDVDVPSVAIERVKAAMQAVAGVAGVRAVEWLPTERKQMHLQSLLAKVPEAVINIDNDGRILVANDAAHVALDSSESRLENRNIREFLSLPVAELLDSRHPHEVVTPTGAFQLEASPVRADAPSGGTVLVLRSAQQMGLQLSDAQAHDQQGLEDIIGESTRIKTLKAQTVRFAQLDLPVLIRGQTGTGKELLARALHHSGPRRDKPFLAINCATLAENLLESELFGYESGAFTGAQKRGKPGLFELAEQGTVFLDEIGEMSVYLQAKLLRFLQDYHFRRIGGTREIAVDVRIVCATHRDLESLTQSGEFREDLFYRLNVLNLTLPPLKERRDDLPLLVDCFVERACRQVNTPLMRFDAEVMEKICRADWPGNIRQLQNTIFRCVALDDVSVFDHLEQRSDQTADDSGTMDAEAVTSLDDAVARYERQLLEALYKHYPSTRKLAQRLGTSHAKIARKLVAYGIGK